MLNLTDKEVKLLTHVSASTDLISQRALAQSTGFSIGLINAVLKRLIHGGYIKAKAINKKKIHYLLTPDGSVQIMKRSYHSITRMIKHYQQLEFKIESLLINLIKDNQNNFYVHGDGELSKIVERVLKKKFKKRAQIVEKLNGQPNVVILNGTGSPLHKEGKIVNLTEYLHNKEIVAEK